MQWEVIGDFKERIVILERKNINSRFRVKLTVY